MSEARDPREELFETIDREAESADESRDSKELYDELRARRDELGGSGHLPPEDRALTDSIREAASKRSQELAGAGAGALSAQERPVPLWLYAAWLVAIVAAALALYYLW